jgi:hypothetical protein
MTDRVREILGWYSSENPGVLANLARLCPRFNEPKMTPTYDR